MVLNKDHITISTVKTIIATVGVVSASIWFLAHLEYRINLSDNNFENFKENQKDFNSRIDKKMDVLLGKNDVNPVTINKIIEESIAKNK